MPLFSSSKFGFKKSPVRKSSNKANTNGSSSQKSGDNDNNNQKDDVTSADSDNEESEDRESGGGSNSGGEVQQIIKTHKKNQAKQNDKSNSKSIKRKNLKGKQKLSSLAFKGPEANKSKATTSKKDKRQDSNVILYLDKSQGLCFQFQSKQALWQDISSHKQQQQQNLNQSEAENNNKSTELLSTSVKSPDLALKSQLTDMSDRNKMLEEENRLLKLKVEILMEMVTETTAELNLKNR